MTTPTVESNKPANVKETLAYLAQQFPQCFSLEGEAKPLKVGIFQDLAERLKENDLISKTQLRQALRIYTSSWRYLEATKTGVARVDLDGAAGELIDDAQAEHAAKTLTESKEKAAAARKARQQEKKAQASADTAARPDNRKKPNKTAATPSNTAKFKKRTTPRHDTKPTIKEQKPLLPLNENGVVAGDKVLVKLGQAPIPAVVLEVHKDDVTVQLGTGMVVKTRQDSLYQA